MFCKKESAVLNGESGEAACDFYHKYREDVALMKKLRGKAFRIALS